MLSVAVVGCAAAHKPTPERISSANYGIYAENHRSTVDDYMKKILFDPYSAVYDDWRGPIKGYFSDKTGSYFGYRVCVEINSKNRTGRYVGSQRSYFLLKEGSVEQMEGGYEYGTIGAYMVKNSCNF